VEIGPDGRLYIADTDNHRVRAVDLATGVIETVAGTGERGFGGDGGRARAARLARPFGVSFDQDGHLHVADTFNGRIRKIARERP
jgi:sugar lactone lactonase YvrE